MDFVLQLENVADGEDKSDIQRLWKKELIHIMYIKQLKIDTGDTDFESDENDDNEEIVIKDDTRLQKTIQGFNERGTN